MDSTKLITLERQINAKYNKPPHTTFYWNKYLYSYLRNLLDSILLLCTTTNFSKLIAFKKNSETVIVMVFSKLG